MKFGNDLAGQASHMLPIHRVDVMLLNIIVRVLGFLKNEHGFVDQLAGGAAVEGKQLAAGA